MQVKTDKTETLVQPRPGHAAPSVNIRVGDQIIEEVEDFTYLGSTLTRNPTCDRDVENRIKAAHSAYDRLWHRVFGNHALTTETKVMAFKAVVLSTLLYACETWMPYRRNIKRLEQFQQSKLRQILKIRWEDKVSNNEVLQRASLPSIEAAVLFHRLRWSGHVSRMHHERLPNVLFHSELVEGERPRGAPKLRYKDVLKRSLVEMEVAPSTWEHMAAQLIVRTTA